MSLRDKLKAQEKKRLEIAARLKALAKKEEESQDGLSAEELAEVDKLAKEAEETKASIEATKKRIAAFDDADEASEDEGRIRRRSRPDTPLAAEPKEEPEFVKDPKKGFKNQQDFFLAVKRQGLREEITDPRLRHLYSAGPGQGVQATAGSDEHGAYADPNGGYLMPTGLAPNMLSRPNETDFITPRCQPIPMATPKVGIAARVDENHTDSVAGGIKVYRRGETQTGKDSKMEMEEIQLEAYELFGAAFATQKLLQFSAISFIAILQAAFRDAFTSRAIQEHLWGTGVGQHKGFYKSGCKVTVSKEVGQPAGTIVYENCVNMRARVWGYGSSIWVANYDTIPQLMLMNQGVETGAVWVQSAKEDVPDMLLGRPIFFTEHAETLGVEGDIGCINPTQYLEGTLTPIQSEESIHVRFLENENTFKFWLMNAGAPWWLKALTPKKGANTLSPVVTLENR